MGAGGFAIDKTKVMRLSFPVGESPIATITCSRRDCESKIATHSNPAMPPSVVAKRARRKGWEVDNEGRDATCPDCRVNLSSRDRTRDRKQQNKQSGRELVLAAAAVEEPSVTVTVPAPPSGVREQDEKPRIEESAMEATTTPSTPRVPTADAMRAQFEAMSLLQNNYNRERNCYDEGWSDERIAKESRWSIDMIVMTRESVYGKMVDPELTELRRSLTALQNVYKQRLDNLQSEIARCESEWKSAADSLRMRIENLAGRK